MIAAHTVKILKIAKYPVTKQLDNFEILESKVYSYDVLGIKGIVLEIKNTSKTPQIIEEKLLSKIFGNTLLVSTSAKFVPVKGAIKAYVVMSRGTLDA
jgi:hypothetical protein